MLTNFYQFVVTWIASVVGGLDLTWLTYYTEDQLEDMALDLVESPYKLEEIPKSKNAVPLTQILNCKYDENQGEWIATAMHDYRPGATIYVDAAGDTAEEAAENLNKRLRELRARAEQPNRGTFMGGWTQP